MADNYPRHFSGFELEIDGEIHTSREDVLALQFTSAELVGRSMKLIADDETFTNVDFVTVVADEEEKPRASVVGLKIVDSSGEEKDPEEPRYMKLLNPFGIRLDILNQYDEEEIEIDIAAAFVVEEEDRKKDEIHERGLIVWQSLSKEIGKAAVCDRVKLILHYDANSADFLDTVEETLKPL